MRDWQLTQELFDLVAGLPALERASLLRESARDNPQLVRRVVALAEADSEPQSGFDLGAASLLTKLQDEPAPEAICGLVFGPYRIETYLSSGGMAHVYRATRKSAGTQRRVALKIMRPELDPIAFGDRFQLERETLATLEHKNIVSFLDAGAIPDGRPFLAMEYVEGVPLTDWRESASRRSKIEIFLQVLSAVQYAHERLVVHRDLKPSNLLVTDQGVPKLLDFGVAAPLQSESHDPSSHGPLTPAYASPEVLAGAAATTMADVYSLGVLLGEFLAQGHDEEHASLGEDLQAIVEKATKPQPELRYRTADQVGRDLERFLNDEPVSARSGSWLYRTRLHLRRHRFAFLLAASIIIASIGGWIGSDIKRRHAQAEASIGWGAHAQAKVTARIFEDWILSSARSDAALSIGAAKFLERAAHEDLSNLPEAETLVRLTLARLFLDQGDIEQARKQLSRASLLVESTRGLGKADLRRLAELEEDLSRAQ